MTVEISLNRRGDVALIDDDDLALVSGINWKRLGKYAIGTFKDVSGVKRMVAMHRLILGAGPGQWCDHKDGNGLDNRRSNIRLCTPSQNAQNRPTRYELRGVSRYGGGFAMCIRCDSGVYRRIGYATKEEAARAYDAASLILHGDFGRRNFPDAVPVVLTGPISHQGHEPHPDIRHLIAPSHRQMVEQRRRIQRAECAAEAARMALDRMDCVAANTRVFPLLGARDAEMMQMRLDGKTLEEVGQHFGLTRERVRQIEAKCRSLGVRFPGERPLSEAAARYMWHPPMKRGRPPKLRVIGHSEAA